MKIPILNGTYTDAAGDFRTAYPRNLVPVPKGTGIGPGYLRPADGVVAWGDALPGVDRGGINWNGVCYRVAGTKLVRISSAGAVTVIGDVGGAPGLAPVTLVYSFDYLAIASGGALWLYNGTTLAQVTDADLGTVLDVEWVDGYFLTTDGTYLVVTELNDPFQVNPLKYGSAEVDPDPVKAVLKLRNEIYAVGRHTIEAFDNVGGDLFPFQRIEGAQVTRGALGTHAACVYLENIAFLGSGRNESPAVWLGANGQSAKISTPDIDTVLAGYTEAQLATAVLEARVDKGLQQLYVHLPDQTLVYDSEASAAMQEKVWYVLTTSVQGLGQYRARGLTWCYDKWLVGDPQAARLGYLTKDVSSHWAAIVGWECSTTVVYNEGKGAIFHELELVALPGRAALGAEATIWTSYSSDGMTYSQERPYAAGRQGQRDKRIRWLQCGAMRNWRIQRFRGTSDAHLTLARLEATLEPLAW